MSQAIWLTLRRDPEAGRAKEVLEREVSSLEPFMEALPSLFVLLYLSLAEPEFFHSSATRPALTRAYGVASFTMTLFLKSGPCFLLSGEGFFSGICKWRFWAVFLVNHYGLHSKIIWSRRGGQCPNFICMVIVIFLVFFWTNLLRARTNFLAAIFGDQNILGPPSFLNKYIDLPHPLPDQTF